MSYCPNCHATIDANAESCPACGALFTGGGWKPVDGEPLPEPEGPSAAGVIVVIGFASVLIPALAFVIGLIFSLLIPGCHCDEGAGCRGCGANALMELLLLGGFSGALLALVAVLPASLLLEAVVGLFTRKT